MTRFKPLLPLLLVALTFSLTSCQKNRCVDCYFDLNKPQTELAEIEVCGYKSVKEAEKATGAGFCRKRD